MKQNDDKLAMLLIELFELKEDVDVIKEAIQNLGRKFRMCLFPVQVNDHNTTSPLPTSN